MPEIMNRVSSRRNPAKQNNNNNVSNGFNHKGNSPGILQSPPEDASKFQRKLGLFNAVAISLGGVIGSGIFIAPKGIINHVGSVGVSLIMWVFCGFLTILAAFCYAELGTAFPSSGAEYTYIFEAFGPVLAFLSLWSKTLVFGPISNAILSLSFARYATEPFYPAGCPVPEIAVQMLAAAAISFLTFLNCCDITKTKKLLNVFMVLKISALLCIIGGGIYSVAWSKGTLESYKDIWKGSKYDAGSLVLASFSGSFAYGGWYGITSLIEELKDPEKNFPRSILISLSAVTTIYVLTNAAYFSVLTPSEVMASNAVASTFVEKLVHYWGNVVPAFVSISILGTLSIKILSTSRSCFVGSRCGQMPGFMGLLTIEHKLPAPATIALSCISFICLLWPDIFVLLEFNGIASSYTNVLTAASLLYLRWKKPDIKRPFRVYIAIPITYFIVTMVITAIPIYAKPVAAAAGAMIVMLGIPVYYVCIGREKPQYKWLHRLNERTTIFVQKIMNALNEDLTL